MTDQHMKTISVEDLLRSGNITRRTYNTLVKARLRTLYDLKKYKTSLRRIFSPQSTSLTEVNELVEKAQQADFLPNITERLFMEPISYKSKGEQLLETLSDEELHLLELVYDNKLHQLLSSRQRAHTVIANALMNVPVASFLRDFLYEDDDRIMILYKVGKTSVEHFVGVKEVMLHEVEQLKEHPEMLRYRIFLQSTHGAFDDDAFILEFFQSHQRLPLLYIMQQLIIGNKSRAEMRAFLGRYDIFEGRVELDTTPIDRSSYTISTYSNTIFDALFSPATSWETLDKNAQEVMTSRLAQESLTAYPDEDFVCEGHPVVIDLIASERLLLSPTGVIGMLGKLLSHRYHVIGGYTRSLLTAKSERWNHICLIRLSLDERYGFRQLFNDFRDEVYAKSVDNTMVDLHDFILQQLPEMEGADDLELAVHILRQLVVGELLLATDEEGRVAVPRKVERSLADRLYILLSNNGQQPMPLTKLTEIINSGDGRQYVKGTVSLTLNKDPRFVNNGKKGLYALTEWQLPYFGSNIDIIYKVLSLSDRPMESDEILDVLNQYPYNESLGKNELSSVISISKDKFRKFGFGYYGLVDREYAPELIKPVRNNFEVDLQAYRDFVETNKRLPSTKGDAEEKRLAYWFARKKKDFETKTNWVASKREAFMEILQLQEDNIERPEELVIPETPKPPEPPENLETPDIPEPLEIPEPPEAPDSLKTPESPAPPESPESLKTPESPEPPEAPESPETPEIPEIPEIPDALLAISPEMVAEPPMALFAMEEDSPFIAPDNAAEPPVEIFFKDDTEAIKTAEDVSQEVAVVSDEWRLRMEEVRQFVESRQREPLALFTEENQMALWLEEQKKRWHAAQLLPSQEQQLLAIRDLLW